jgi:hypothetical protein
MTGNQARHLHHRNCTLTLFDAQRLHLEHSHPSHPSLSYHDIPTLTNNNTTDGPSALQTPLQAHIGEEISETGLLRSGTPTKERKGDSHSHSHKPKILLKQTDPASRLPIPLLATVYIP